MLLSSFQSTNETGEPGITAGPQRVWRVGACPRPAFRPCAEGASRGPPLPALGIRRCLPPPAARYLARVPIGMSSDSTMAWVYYLCDLGEVT